MERKELIEWILKMERRLGLDLWTSADGSERYLDRFERAEFFGTADLVARLRIQVMLTKGRIIEDTFTLKGMVVNEDSPMRDLEEWARRLEARLEIDEAQNFVDFDSGVMMRVPIEDRPYLLGERDHIARLQRMEISALDTSNAAND